MSPEPRLQPVHAGPRDWNAGSYERVSMTQINSAPALLDRMALNGDETVLDAGCGPGQVTEKLLERLPRGRVIAVDGSASMVEHARRTLAGRTEVIWADLAALELENPVDAIFSNAVFHWLPDHDALFSRLYAALRPGGRLVAECGGEGNVASLERAIGVVGACAPYEEHLAGMPRIWNFASAERTEQLLRAAGFTAVRCWLEPRPVAPPAPLEYLATVTLGAQLDRLPAELRDAFVGEVASELGTPLILDYVRLQIDASR